MAKTTINIPGVSPIEVPFAMGDIGAVRNFLSTDYPQISNMQDALTTAANGDVTVTFSQRTGTKG